MKNLRTRCGLASYCCSQAPPTAQLSKRLHVCMGAHESLPHSQHVDSAFADADQNEVPDIAVAKGLPNSERESAVVFCGDKMS